MIDYSNEDLRDAWRDSDLLEEIEDERSRLAKAPTLPAPAPFVCVKACGCGARFDAAGWSHLTRVGYQVVPADADGDEDILEMKNCLCGSTLNLPVTADDVDVVAETRRAEGDDAMAEERAETERAWREGTF